VSSTVKPTVLSLTTNCCRVVIAFVKRTVCRPTRSLIGRSVPTSMSIVLSGCFPNAIPASNRTFCLGWPVRFRSCSGSVFFTNFFLNLASSSGVNRTTVATASSNPVSMTSETCGLPFFVAARALVHSIGLMPRARRKVKTASRLASSRPYTTHTLLPRFRPCRGSRPERRVGRGAGAGGVAATGVAACGEWTPRIKIQSSGVANRVMAMPESRATTRAATSAGRLCMLAASLMTAYTRDFVTPRRFVIFINNV